MSHPNHKTLNAWLNGSLVATELAEVEDHVADCPECEDTLAELEAAKNTIAGRIQEAADGFQPSSYQPPKRPSPSLDATTDGPILQSSDSQRKILETAEVAADVTITQLLNQRGLSAGVDLDQPSQFTDGQSTANRSAGSDHVRQQQQVKYDNARVIAKGGMGAVLDAKDTCLRRHVAMKVMLDADAESDKIVRFVEEAQITGQLEHPSIVPVHELGVNAEGNVFYTMKLIHGDSLKHILKNINGGNATASDSFSLNRLLNIFSRVCDAIAFAHSKRVVHRDLKPDNIMVGQYGEVLVVDWGLAKILRPDDVEDPMESSGDNVVVDSLRQDAGMAEMTVDGTVMGTPAFMSPEQASGRLDLISQRTDVYALGAILYNILALRSPIQADNLGELLRKVRSGKIEPLTSAESAPWSIPQSLEKVCMKAMATKPADRYESVTQLSADIDAFQGGFATSVENAGFFRQARLLVNRHRGIASSIAIAAVLMIAGSLLYLSHLKTARDDADTAAAAAKQSAAEAIASAKVAEDATALALDREKEANTQLGKTQIALAEAAYLSGEGTEAIKRLELCPENVRDTNWHYLRRYADESLYRIDHGLIRGVFADSVNPGTFYLGDQHSGIKRVDGATGKIIETLQCNNVSGHMTLSPDGKQIGLVASHSGDPTRIFKTNPLSQPAVIRIKSTIGTAGDCFFDSSGNFFSKAQWGTRVFASGSTEAEVIKDLNFRCCDQKGQKFYGMKDDRLFGFDRSTSKVLWTGPQKAGGWLCSMEISPDDSMLVLAFPMDGMITIHRTSDGKLINRLNEKVFSASRLFFANNSNHFVSIGDGKGQNVINVWYCSESTNDPVRKFFAYNDSDRHFDWDQTANVLMGGFRKTSAYPMPRVDAAILPTLCPRDSVLFLSENEIAFHDPRKGMTVFDVNNWEREYWVNSFNRQLTRSYSRDITIAGRLVNSHVENPVHPFMTCTPDGEREHVTMGFASVEVFAVSKNGKYVAAASSGFGIQTNQCNGDGTSETVMKLGSLPSEIDGPPILLFPACETTTDGQPSAGQRLLVSFVIAANKQTSRVYRLYDLQTKKMLLEKRDPVTATVMTLDPTGKVLCTGSADGLIRGYDVDTLELRFETRVHDEDVTALAYAADGKRIATGDAKGLIRIWHIQDDVPTVLADELAGNDAVVTCLDFNLSGKRLISVAGQRMRLWKFDDVNAVKLSAATVRATTNVIAPAAAVAKPLAKPPAKIVTKSAVDQNNTQAVAPKVDTMKFTDSLGVVGRYRRNPKENEWHEGEIVITGNGRYEWKNQAGRVWKLTADEERKVLEKSANADYYDEPNGKELKLKIDDDENVIGFRHGPDFFMRVEKE